MWKQQQIEKLKEGIGIVNNSDMNKIHLKGRHGLSFFMRTTTNLVVVIVLMIIFESSTVVSASSVTDYKKASTVRVHSRGFNDVVDDDSSHPPDEPYNDEDYGDYSQELGNGHHLDSEDIHILEEWDGSHETQAPSEIAKCCSVGEAFNAEGSCHKIDTNYKPDRTRWYPEKMFVVKQEMYVPLNLSTWNVSSAHKITCHKNQKAEILSDLGKFVLLSDGVLFVLHHQQHINPLDFCFEQQIGKSGRAIMACFEKEELNASDYTLRKCCPHKSIVTHQQHSNKTVCVIPSEHYSLPPGNWTTIIHGVPECDYGVHLSEIRKDEAIQVERDGTLITNSSSGNSIKAPLLNYCLDHFSFQDQEVKLKVLMCLDHDEPGSAENNRGCGSLISTPPGVNVVCGVALIVSSVCLALAAIISLRLPELRSLHGKCQLSHLATLFCLFVLLAASHLGQGVLPKALCTYFGVAIHFFALSSFLWLNLLCVNIYLTFRSIRPPLAARRGETRRLFFLCVYAWGIPAAFCLFLFVLDKAGTLEPMTPPQYGQCKCGMSNREAEFAYLYGPVGVLLLCNGILFCLTAQELLCGLWRLDNSDSINFRRKSMGIVVAKLGIVMGVGWIIDVTSWGAGKDYPYFFYAADLFNSLQGLFIFIVLIWRKRVLEVLHLRKPSIIKDDTITGRPFLFADHKNSTLSHTLTNGDQDTSLISAQDG